MVLKLFILGNEILRVLERSSLRPRHRSNAADLADKPDMERREAYTVIVIFFRRLGSGEG